jgi:diphthamide synthase (EF-2-diphthine--ammonia ligase)
VSSILFIYFWLE